MDYFDLVAIVLRNLWLIFRVSVPYLWRRLWQDPEEKHAVDKVVDWLIERTPLQCLLKVLSFDFEDKLLDATELLQNLLKVETRDALRRKYDDVSAETKTQPKLKCRFVAKGRKVGANVLSDDGWFLFDV